MWRELAAAVPHATRIDADSYALELDAVDDALCRAEAWVPTPIDEQTLAIVETGDGPPIELIGHRWPQPSIRGDDPARIAVAVLQRFAWNVASNWHAPDLDAPLDGYSAHRFTKLYGMASTLLSRRLRPTPEVAADLVAFAIIPPCSAEQQGRDDFLYPILKVLERQFTPPVTSTLRAALTLLIGRVESIRANQIARRRRFRQRLASKRQDLAIERARRLIG
jgi:hypothetical protein